MTAFFSYVTQVGGSMPVRLKDPFRGFLIPKSVWAT